MAKKEYVITYVEKVYYKPVVVEAEEVEEAVNIFLTERMPDLDVVHVQKAKLEVEEG